MPARAVVRAIASHLPERVLTNEELAARPNAFAAEAIFEKTGVLERRVAAEGECASDLAYAAARKLFEAGAAAPGDIDFLLYCTQSPDYFLPASACVLQDRLGLPRSCGALDFNQGCSGFVYGLSLAKGLIESGQARRLLLLTADTYTRYIHPLDRSTCTLFGDGASATLVEAADGGEAGLDAFVFGTDGRGARQLIVPTGAHRQPRSAQTAVETTDADGNVRSSDNLYMNGREIFRFAISEVPRAMSALLERAGLNVADIDWLVPHQANRFMLDELVKRLGVPREKTPYVFENSGNTVSSTIPIALEAMLADGRLKSGDRTALIGFGVGYSWAACTMRWA